MELRQYFSMLWKWIWMIVLATGLAAGANYIATSRQPKMYQASAKLLVGQSLQSTNPNAQDIQTSGQLAQTYIQIAKTTLVLQGAIDTLGLQMTPEVLGERFTASLIPDTQLIQLRVDDTDPERAQALANELARQLTLQGPATRQDSKQREFVQKQVDELQRKIEEGQKTITDLQNTIQLDTSAREIAAKQAQITMLENQINQWQQSYSALLGFLAPRSPNYLSIVEPAELPRTPFAPNVMLSTLLAAAVGFILSLGTALVVEYLDDTIKNPDDVTQVLGLPTLSSLAKITEPIGRRSDQRKLVTLSAPRSAAAEAYRVLRTSIQLGGVDKPIKSILVTSSTRAEGKSLTAANLAVVMAQGGLRTILVDGDLRKPFQHRLFGISNNDVGLTNSLSKPGTIDEFLRPTKVENLRLLTSGPLPPDPAELLGSERMRALKARLEAEVDMLIFDSPPCLPVADTAILARLLDRAILVVDVSHTRRKDALRAKEILHRAGARVLGVVLNRVHTRGADYYYYDAYTSHNDQPETLSDSTTTVPSSAIANWLRALVRH